MSGRLALAFVPAFLLASGPPPWALGPGEVSAGLEETGLSLGLRLGVGPAEIRLGLEADSEEARLRAGFRSPFLVAGPGSAAGPLRALADPAAFGQGLSFGLRARDGPALSPPLALDPALESGTSVLGVSAGAGPLSLAAFALAPGLAGGLLAARPGLGSPSGTLPDGGRLSPPAAPEAASAGLALGLPLGRGGLCLAAGAVYRRGSEGEGGWSPDPLPEPPSKAAYAALVAEGESDRGRAALALAASCGARAGAGLAFRLEAFSKAGALSSRAFAGAAGAAFRNLYGEAPSRRLGAGLDLRLALYRGASLALSARLESPAPEPARPVADGETAGLPALGRSGSLGLSLPLARVVFEPRLELSRAPDAARPEALAALRLKGEGRGFSSEPASAAAAPASAVAPATVAARPALMQAAAARSSSGYAWRLELEDSFLLDGGGLRSLGLSLGLKSHGTGGSPRFFADLELRLRPAAEPEPGEGAAEAPLPAALAQAGLLSAVELSAKARLGLDLPLRAGASLELEASLPEIPLALLEPGQRQAGFELSAAYRAPFGP